MEIKGSTIADIAREFVSWQQPLPGWRVSVADRWTLILTHQPLVRGRLIYEDMTDVFEGSINTTNYEVMVSAYDLSLMRLSFFSLMEENKRGMDHVNAYHAVDMMMWSERYFDKIRQTEPGHTKKKERIWVPPKVPIVPKHTWMH